MPGFYKNYNDRTEWKNFAALPGGLEMTFEEPDILLNVIIPHISQACLIENCPLETLEYYIGTYTSTSGKKYGQICCTGKAYA